MTSKKFKKENCFNSHDGCEKTSCLGISAEGYRQNTEFSRCIFQISQISQPSHPHKQSFQELMSSSKASTQISVTHTHTHTHTHTPTEKEM